MAKLNYVWRVVATGVCFISFFLGSIVLAYFVMLPILWCVKKLKDKEHSQKTAQWMISGAFSVFVKLMQILGLAKFEFIGFEKLQQDQGCLFIANHPTLIDYVVITSRLSACDNIVKSAMWERKFIRHIISQAGYIPNIEPEKTFKCIERTLAKGNNLLMFPEGTRSTPKSPIQIKRGAAQIAIRTGAPIRLIHIVCKPSTLAKNDKWYTIPTTKPVFSVIVGDKLISKDILNDTKELPSLAARKLTVILQKHIDKGYTLNE
ncbi:lysophospholipid acyltransferase family protein [Fangia hongkongensis]|uniref:lysophospholipid acyltransferase family protein n=1 Tax=Fangia hongkongensis TaxID=270495 RepID=UPI000378CC6A|nr:lysophospholipid acyltransferase family protein [Fangia hongkongensis]MBK2124793.1 1-acyl-sn-glycerol-3-phosphate acyltransferase [Fangia hongkongensis]